MGECFMYVYIGGSKGELSRAEQSEADEIVVDWGEKGWNGWKNRGMRGSVGWENKYIV